jgi:hypothetical protein
MTRIAIDGLNCGHCTIAEEKLPAFGLEPKASLVTLTKRLVCKLFGKQNWGTSPARTCFNITAAHSNGLWNPLLRPARVEFHALMCPEDAHRRGAVEAGALALLQYLVEREAAGDELLMLDSLPGPHRRASVALCYQLIQTLERIQ